MGTGDSVLGGKAANPSSAEINNVWSYTSTPPYVFMTWCLVKSIKTTLFTYSVLI